VAQDGVNQRDARELFRRMVFNILMDNTDDHEKNHALLVVNPYDNGKLKLAPAYDVLPTHSGQGYQEFICGADGRDSTLDNAMSECGAFGLQPDEAAHEVATVIGVVNTWRSHFVQIGMTPSDIEHLAAFIDGDVLLEQRRGFDPTRYAKADAKGARHARRGPFSDQSR
jgi:serine/threonine-protein kinase HipA